jgi:hypothetical protein
MAGQTLSHDRVLRKLGEGGMDRLRSAPGSPALLAKMNPEPYTSSSTGTGR